MAVDLKKMEHVDIKTEYTVSGYIRESHNSFKSDEYTLFQTIPSEIPLLCTLYYHFSDYFEIPGNNVSVSDDGKTLSYNGEGWQNTTYSSLIIKSMDNYIYNWKFQHTKAINFFIGIASNKTETDIPYDEVPNSKFYCFCTYCNTKNSHKLGGFTSIEKKMSWNDVNEVGLEINLRKKQFTIYNDNEREVIFDKIETGKDINYRFAVTFYDKNAQFSMLKFESQ